MTLRTHTNVHRRVSTTLKKYTPGFYSRKRTLHIPGNQLLNRKKMKGKQKEIKQKTVKMRIAGNIRDRRGALRNISLIPEHHLL